MVYWHNMTVLYLNLTTNLSTPYGLRQTSLTKITNPYMLFVFFRLLVVKNENSAVCLGWIQFLDEN